jgi:hypothetical protein
MPEENDMKRFYAGLVYAAVAALVAAVAPARAAPPTVVPSPGYDARLQEQRDARVIHEPVFVPVARPITRRHVKHHHDVVR